MKRTGVGGEKEEMAKIVRNFVDKKMPFNRIMVRIGDHWPQLNYVSQTSFKQGKEEYYYVDSTIKYE